MGGQGVNDTVVVYGVGNLTLKLVAVWPSGKSTRLNREIPGGIQPQITDCISVVWNLFVHFFICATILLLLAHVIDFTIVVQKKWSNKLVLNVKKKPTEYQDWNIKDSFKNRGVFRLESIPFLNNSRFLLGITECLMFYFSLFFKKGKWFASLLKLSLILKEKKISHYRLWKH